MTADNLVEGTCPLPARPSASSELPSTTTPTPTTTTHTRNNATTNTGSGDSTSQSTTTITTPLAVRTRRLRPASEVNGCATHQSSLGNVCHASAPVNERSIQRNDRVDCHRTANDTVQAPEPIGCQFEQECIGHLDDQSIQSAILSCDPVPYRGTEYVSTPPSASDVPMPWASPIHDHHLPRVHSLDQRSRPACSPDTSRLNDPVHQPEPMEVDSSLQAVSFSSLATQSFESPSSV